MYYIVYNMPNVPLILHTKYYTTLYYIIPLILHTKYYTTLYYIILYVHREYTEMQFIV